MSVLSVWVHFYERNDEARAAEVLSELARTGVQWNNRNGAAHGAGILFFSTCSAELPALVQEMSRGSLERVVLVDLRDSAPNDGVNWRLLSAGAVDVLRSGTPLELARALHARLTRWAEVDRLIASPLIQRNLIGDSRTWRATLRTAVEAARFTDAPILLLGESGTGKELLARAIHSLDARADRKDLIVLDCTTIMPELSGSEFFGHERGSYTGAVGAREGAFARAHRGTLFLDEVGELPHRLQAQLLRVVQEHTYKRVGGDAWQRTDFRLITATHRNLSEMVADGHFRADLYYRLASVGCRVPPLHERPEDILPLFLHFFEELRPEVALPALSPDVRQFLLQRAYPGNVRDLRQLVARIAYRYAGAGPITVGDLPEAERPQFDEHIADWRDGPFEGCIRRALLQGAGLRDISRSSADTAIRIAVQDAGGNMRQAAQTLGVTDRALHLRKAAHKENGVV
jgi:transcriptional regulator with GAF, ATPase, and Fis domain